MPPSKTIARKPRAEKIPSIVAIVNYLTGAPLMGKQKGHIGG
jgi:hypothetical protein